MNVYVITVWTDKNGKMNRTSVPVYAENESEAKAKFKSSHLTCKSVDGCHKK